MLVAPVCLLLPHLRIAFAPHVLVDPLQGLAEREELGVLFVGVGVVLDPGLGQIEDSGEFGPDQGRKQVAVPGSHSQQFVDSLVLVLEGEVFILQTRCAGI
jgi:hypothetical protein